jgi:hypothetical protein
MKKLKLSVAPSPDPLVHPVHGSFAMKKLRLNHEDLRVESFGTAPDARQRGTVMGRDYTYGAFTCYEGCHASGEYTCHDPRGQCNGLSAVCQSEGVTDCPGYDTCDPISYNGGFTCYNSCTNVEACSFCGQLC